VLANAFLESDIARLSAQVSAGFARGRLRSSKKSDNQDRSWCLVPRLFSTDGSTPLSRPVNERLTKIHAGTAGNVN
jgi:hypothetical protein